MNPDGALKFRGLDWRTVRWRLEKHYAQLTDEDLAYVPEGEDALIDRVAARTMDSRRNIERFLSEECGCQ
jgi:hypothetical protein